MARSQPDKHGREAVRPENDATNSPAQHRKCDSEPQNPLDAVPSPSRSTEPNSVELGSLWRQTAATLWNRGSRAFIVGVVSLALTAQPVVAQEGSAAFCETAMADTLRNIFEVLQLAGPLIGGVVALGAVVLIPTVRRADHKQELKQIRNQAVIWGVIAAPISVVMLRFVLNNIVAGGSSCAF